MGVAKKKAKIVATLGPASRSKKMIEQLLRRGVDVFRINFSHGSHIDHELTLRNITSVASRM
ncbi:MAG: pyruvate kinase, partial [Chitinivibrionales bacterium]|nr:pyruvate kinase [Chitinivibrionales bacterium]